jgi:hypothetical protein
MAVMLVLLEEGIYTLHGELGSDVIIYTPSFLKIGTGVEGILTFCLRKLRACNIDITNELRC